MEIKKLLYNSFNQCFFEARFLYKDESETNPSTTERTTESTEESTETVESKKAEVVAASSIDQDRMRTKVESTSKRSRTREEIEKSYFKKLDRSYFQKTMILIENKVSASQ